MFWLSSGRWGRIIKTGNDDGSRKMFFVSAVGGVVNCRQILGGHYSRHGFPSDSHFIVLHFLSLMKMQDWFLGSGRVCENRVFLPSVEERMRQSELWFDFFIVVNRPFCCIVFRIRSSSFVKSVVSVKTLLISGNVSECRKVGSSFCYLRVENVW